MVGSQARRDDADVAQIDNRRLKARMRTCHAPTSCFGLIQGINPLSLNDAEHKPGPFWKLIFAIFVFFVVNELEL
jgi:hypothetical protein